MINEASRTIGSAVVGLLLVASASAGTLHVPTEYSTIGAALGAAHHGDRIVVADGVYTGPDNRDLDFAGKHIRLRSENGPDHCVIDCESQGRAFSFHSGEPHAATLEGFTIRGGLADHNGGAILCDASSPTIRNCLFRENTVQPTLYEGGGAICLLDRSKPRVIDCVFEDNVATSVPFTGGGAVGASSDSRVSFVRCEFTRNSANAGGAVAVVFGAFAHFQDCVFTQNAAEPQDAGGGVMVSDARAILEDCQFTHNRAYGGGGVCVLSSSVVTVRRCLFSGNNAYGDQGGGGMGVYGSRADVEDSMFVGNSGASDGGALGVWADGDLTVRNSTIAGNEAYLQDGHAYGGAICGWASRATFSNCVVHANKGIEGNAFSLVEPFDGYYLPMVLTVTACLTQEGEAGVFVEDPDDSDF